MITSEEKMREALPSDSEIAAAFDNTNFGSTDYKGIVLEGLRKTALGYHNGWTLTQILRRLGLADARGDGNVLNKRGLDYVLQAALQESEAGAVGGKYRVEIENCGITHVAYVDDLEFGKAIVDVFVAPPSAQAIETAAIMKCVELCNMDVPHRVAGSDTLWMRKLNSSEIQERLRALIPQDGRTQYEQKCMEVAEEVRLRIALAQRQTSDYYLSMDELVTIVTNLIGVPPLNSEGGKK